MNAPVLESSMKPNGWITAAKWTCVVSSFLLAANLLVVSLLADLELRVIVQNVVAGVLFIVCGVAYITQRRWVVTYTRIIVLLLFVGAAMYWYQTRQWIGVLPSVLLFLLMWQSNRLESSLKAQQGAAPNGGPATPVDNPNAPGGPPSVS